MYSSLHTDDPILIAPDNLQGVTGVLVYYHDLDAPHFKLIGNGECVVMTDYFLRRIIGLFDWQIQDEIQLGEFRFRFIDRSVISRTSFYQLVKGGA